MSKNRIFNNLLSIALSFVMLSQGIMLETSVYAESLPAETVLTQGWDFEDNMLIDWTAQGFTPTIEKGMVSFTSTADCYLENTAEIDADIFKYLVVKARSNSSDDMKFSFKTNGETEYGTAIAIPMSATTDEFKGFTEYIFDLSENAEWLGTYTQGKLEFGTSTVDIEDITFYSAYDKDETAREYHIPINATEQTSQGAKLTLYGTTLGDFNSQSAWDISELESTGRAMILWFTNLTDLSLPTDTYGKMVIKLKSSKNVTVSSPFIVTTDSGGWITSIPSPTSTPNGDYIYYVIDLSEINGYSGNLKEIQFRISLSESEESGFIADIADVYVADKFVPVKDPSEIEHDKIDKIGLYSSDDEINTDNGTITITPYLRYADGRENKDVNLVTDTVNGQLKLNSDGTATVIGQLNGTVKIKAFRPDTDLYAEKTITISNQPDRLAANEFKLMTFGNSITFHWPAENLGWTGNWGMAASSQDKDYVHRLQYYLTQKYGQGTVDQVYGCGPDSNPTQLGLGEGDIGYDSIDQKFIDNLPVLVQRAKDESANIITIQMGENVKTNPTEENYKNALKLMVNEFKKEIPDAVIILCTSFWGNPESGLVKGTAAAAEELGITYAPLHTLNTNANKAYDQFTNEGVARHPGDAGMDNIAKLMFDAINTQLSANERTRYTTPPTDVKITDGEREITAAGGTLQLNAGVLPASTAQDIKWSVSDENIAKVTDGGLLTGYNNGTVKVRATCRFDESLYDEVEITVSGQTIPYTVTYDKNTTDTVTNMPEPNTWAKLGFTFDKVFPEREYYKFLGWALTPDGDAVESVDVTEDITVYAKWGEATAWYFDCDGYLEGWTGENAFHFKSESGVMTAVATEMDTALDRVLKFNSPLLNISPADKGFKSIRFKMKNSDFNNDSRVKVKITTSSGVRSFDAPVSSVDWEEYDFPITDDMGIITGIQIIPTNIDCTVQIDEIYFSDYERPAVPTLWTFEKETENWTVGGDAEELRIENGAAVMDVTGGDPNFISPDMSGGSIALGDGSDDTFNYIRLRIKNKTNGPATGKIFFATATHNLNGSNDNVSFSIPNNTNDYVDVFVRMTDASEWKGTLKQFRIDGVDGTPAATEGTIMIDEIELMSISNETVIFNKEFDDADESDALAGVSKYNNTISQAVDPTNADNKVMKVNVTNRYGNWAIPASFEKGDKYKFKYKIKRLADTELILREVIYGTDNQLLNQRKPGANWTTNQSTFTVSHDTAKTVGIFSEGTGLGEYLVDNVTLTRFDDFAISDKSRIKDDAKGVDIYDNINILFNETVSAPDCANVHIYDKDNNEITVNEVFANQTTLSVKHEALQSNTEYTLVIDTISDNGGRTAKNICIKFRTKDDIEVSGFEFTSVSGNSATVTGTVVNNLNTPQTLILKLWEYGNSAMTALPQEYSIIVNPGVNAISNTFENITDNAKNVSSSVWIDNENIRPVSKSINSGI